jgi:hydrogenase expression/formation protein HypE
MLDIMQNSENNINCPVPQVQTNKVTLAHGSGGRMSYKLINEVFLKSFSNPFLEQEHDGAVINIGNEKIAFTTDSFVVKPLFFPGGDIGKLAVYGTVNDLAMCGADPVYLSASFILEEGFEINLLKEIVNSMQAAADYAGIKIITGDTKVVERGCGDGIFINTSGIGVLKNEINISPSFVKPGDAVILSGTIADHGMTILAARENLDFEGSLKSDCAPLNKMTGRLLAASENIHCMRDPTRGGLATALNEIALKSGYDIYIDEEKIKVNNNVNAVCEILGFDPLYTANEGKMICFADANDASILLEVMRNSPEGKEAEIIGKVSENRNRRVILKTLVGTSRLLDMLTGDQLPRIC